jgi:RNA polymerase sigma factor (sigma-70 family)
MALLNSTRAFLSKAFDKGGLPSRTGRTDVRSVLQSGTIAGRKPAPMLRVVDGRGELELRDKRNGPDGLVGGRAAPAETPIPKHGDEAAMRELLRSQVTPRPDPLADLAVRATHGDEVAMRELLRAIGTSLLAAVRAVAGRNAPDVEDIAQEAMVAFVQALPAFRRECSVNHYMSRIAVRSAVAARKRRALRENRADAFEDEDTSEAFAASPGDEVWAGRRREALRALLDELPEVQAETFALRVALGYSMQEVASATGAPVNTVRSRLRLAREALRRRIEQDPSLSEVLGGET